MPKQYVVVHFPPGVSFLIFGLHIAPFTQLFLHHFVAKNFYEWQTAKQSFFKEQSLWFLLSNKFLRNWALKILNVWQIDRQSSTSFTLDQIVHAQYCTQFLFTESGEKLKKNEIFRQPLTLPHLRTCHTTMQLIPDFYVPQS